MPPRTIDGMTHVCYFRHALALDERRVKFLPEYTYGGSAKPLVRLGDKNTSPVNQEFQYKYTELPTGNEDGPMVDDIFPDDKQPTKNKGVVNGLKVGPRSTGARPHTMEVWFAGTHSDM